MPWTHTLEFRADILNLTNTVSFGFPTAVYTDSAFGRILRTTVSTSRKIQLGLKYTF